MQLSRLCKVRIGPNDEIYKLAQEYQRNRRISAKDAIHLACAAYVEADRFLTCDDNLVKRARSLKLRFTVMNPVDYIRRGVT